ncbi:MBL fold metallo-hydrolase [Tengunoibacter tsumagoiensis]|uniref:Metallo-beta-lactamase domain-containing protein n=1 Tax=Tengunoibacter tsumagoiensis TaxID=2014871 RepID=A0A402A341_9CHLR|nr:MBL fold metallo-hydrolase [Tengunoibacter tsumagoiensis]GCE13554.1 hypothetical protein KTT_34130 [Tengunoibacter tsumagoiensis]
MDYMHTVVLPTTREQVSLEQGSLFFIGNATVLLRYAGFTLLTDPNFLHMGEHVHLGYGVKSTRLLNPAIHLDQLPALDMVILSHLHEDHFDRMVAHKLNKLTPIATTPKAAEALQKKGFSRTYPLETWQTLSLVKNEVHLHITALPGRHGPGLAAKLLPPVMGSLLEFVPSEKKSGFRMYISGDTLVYKQLKEIPKRYPEIDLGLFHLGGTKIFGLLVTMDAKQGVEALKLINPRLALPIHYNDYTAFTSSLEDFKREVIAAGLERQVLYLGRGESYTFEVPGSRR